MLTELLDRGIRLKLSNDGRLLVKGDVSEADDAMIRRNREYLVMELANVNPSEPTPEQVKLAGEIEQEVGVVLAGLEFVAWSPDCRKSWARSILNIVAVDGLTIKGSVRGILDDIAQRGV